MTEREHADVSRRNPDTLEKRETSRWLDIGSAIVLALATMASAWCGYQSALWSGVQTFRLAAVSTLSPRGCGAIHESIGIAWAGCEHVHQLRRGAGTWRHIARGFSLSAIPSRDAQGARRLA